jgi:hypothetical protein
VACLVNDRFLEWMDRIFFLGSIMVSSPPYVVILPNNRHMK